MADRKALDKKENEEKKVLKKRSKLITLLGKAWHFIWYDDSALSWIVNILLAYVLIKFIVYPGLGLLLGTHYPIVAVVSNSMEHRTAVECADMNIAGDCLRYSYTICGKSYNQSMKFSQSEFWDACGDYYMSLNITSSEFHDYPFPGGFNKGDIMLLIGKKPDDIKVGDVIVFQSKKPYPIIHRVIKKNQMGMWVFETKGDHNLGQIRDFELDETRVLEKQLLGKAVIRIPWLGYVKIWFVELLKLIGFGAA
jgi:signal peptidase I